MTVILLSTTRANTIGAVLAYYGLIDLPYENIEAAISHGIQFAEIKKNPQDLLIGTVTVLVRISREHFDLLVNSGINLVRALYLREGEKPIESVSELAALSAYQLIAELNFCDWQIATLTEPTSSADSSLVERVSRRRLVSDEEREHWNVSKMMVEAECFRRAVNESSPSNAITTAVAQVGY